VIAAATFRKRGLDPQLEVVAMGHLEGRVFFNPSPERDSLFELLPDVVQPGQRDSRLFARLLVEAQKLNGDQTDHAKTVAGFLDSIASQLADAELNNPLRRAIGSRALARAVRPHLKQIASADRVDSAVLLAIRQVEKVTVGVLRQQVLSPAVERELGAKLYPLLVDIVGGTDREGSPS
jgi:hypothetical protein